MIADAIDKATRDAIRNRSDELAAQNGCRYDAARGADVVSWIQDYCKLYEGEWAGEPMILRDWQLDVVMRLFSWVRYSERWGREIRRFRKGSIWVPKKNKKSPTLAAIGLYLLAGDGENGGKVFFGAKDGTQAREIAGRHAIEMVQSSEELSAECSINKSKLQITHEKSRSILLPLSSGDTRSTKTKEGLNGSILIDETHVVDEEYIGRISRLGISRSEPFHLEFSTVGDDPESYGYSAWDYGRQVERGDIEDESYFYACYSAPQDVTDKELDADIVKYGKMANPAWGHTIGEEEFLADYKSSRRRPTEWALFKKYRLNIWQSVASPFIDREAWRRCETQFTEEELEGQLCYGGLDLAKTNDMTAFVLVFPREGGCYRVLPFFWLPEERVKEVGGNHPEWKEKGLLRTTPGNVCDYADIMRDMEQIAMRFSMPSFAYDPYQAEHFTQEFEKNTGIVRLPFQQTMANFANPTGEVERLITGALDKDGAKPKGYLQHNGHPILTWQAGHTQVKTDARGNKYPIKPKHGDAKKIDGIVSMIMAAALAMKEGAEQGITEAVYL